MVARRCMSDYIRLLLQLQQLLYKTQELLMPICINELQSNSEPFVQLGVRCRIKKPASFAGFCGGCPLDDVLCLSGLSGERLRRYDDAVFVGTQPFAGLNGDAAKSDGYIPFADILFHGFEWVRVQGAYTQR